jgi:Uma2 family endonuclease
MPSAAAIPPTPSRRARPPKPLLTAEEFLDWLEPGVKADLIEGVVQMHLPVNLRHADLLNFIDFVLRGYVEQRELGKLYRELVAVRLSQRTVFLPDLAFFTPGQRQHFENAYIADAPTFALEVLSTSSRRQDLGDKFAKYELHGVQEYWVLDPDELHHRFYRREGEYLVEFGKGEGLIRSVSIRGFWVKRAWLNPDRLPAVHKALAEVLGGR